MGEWQLTVENIGGFSESKTFSLIPGLNWVFGENATGKSSLVNSLKMLNNLKQYFKNIGRPDDFKTFVHSGESKCNVSLKNSGKSYMAEYNEVFTSGGSSKLLEDKFKQESISDDPLVIDFAFIDTSNPVMNSIEFNGNIQYLKDRIREISRIKDYFKIQDVARVLFKKYKDLKEEKIKETGYKIKEYSLMVEQKNADINDLEKEISNIQDLSEDEAQIQELNHLKGLKQQIFADLNKIKIKNIDRLVVEIRDLHLKHKKIQDSLGLAEHEIERLKAYKDLEGSVQRLKDEQNELRVQKVDNDRKIGEKDKEIDAKNYKKRIWSETLNSGKTQCDHCLNKINPQMLNEIIINVSEEIKKLHTEKKELEDQARHLIAELDEKYRKEIELQKIKPNQTEIEQRINKFQKEISTIEKKINEKDNEKLQNEDALKVLQNQLNEINAKIINMSSINEEARADYMNKLASINTLKEERRKIEVQKESLLQKSVLVSDNISKLIKKTEHVITELDDFIEKYYYALLDETNKELESMKNELNWGFRSILINDDLEIEVQNQVGMKIEFFALSDFERKSISILILYIMKNKFFPEYPLFILDEHMNSADEERCSTFVKLIQERERGKNHILIVTSNKHNSVIENGQTLQEVDSLKIFHVN